MSEEYPPEVQQLIGRLISLTGDKNDAISDVATDLLWKWDKDRK